MSALAMILIAAMVVPGDVPEKVPMEVVQTLDASGEWEGTCKTSDGMVFKAKLEFQRAPSHPAILSLSGAGHFIIRAVTFADEGAGKLRMTWDTGETYLALYQQQDNRFAICLGNRPDRPTSFRVSDSQHLLILHRVKLRK